MPRKCQTPEKTDEKNNNDDANTKDADAKKARLRQEFASLHKEMEIAGFAKGPSGQLRRKVPRKESVIRTRKRKLLEVTDADDLALLGDDHAEQRLRGSKAAIDDHIIKGSLSIGLHPTTPKPAESLIENERPQASPKESSNNFEDFGDDEDDDVDEDSEDDDDNDNDDDNDDDDDDDQEEEEDMDEEDNEDDAATETAGSEGPKGNTLTTPSSTSSNKPRKKYKRRMHRLKNFQSLRMAERHGDALAAHARGQPKVAIEKLKQVARDAPSAPQIYSSLGMVYEDMLKESRKRSFQEGTQPTTPTKDDSEVKDTESNEAEEGPTLEDEKLPDPALAEQLDLAKRAYGSYHVAAILCKKDFTLWVRAAEMASDIAEIHGQAMALPNIALELREYHRSEEKRWHSEALRDFIGADNLKPSGIDVPAKLASMHMELGNLLEALTILTDLKNRSRSTAEGGSRPSEFQASYKAWILYGDLMLRIGHECIQWNRGVQTNENYMFRRWLRKLSAVFDWQERRMQSLALALEAAAGTKSTERFTVWMRQRAMATKKPQDEEKEVEKDRWHLDVNDGILEQHKPGEEPASDQTQLVDDGTANETDEAIAGQEKEAPSSSKKRVSFEETEGDEGKTLSPNSKGEPADGGDKMEHFEAEKKLLLDKHRSELEAFDKTSTDMSLDSGSIALKNQATIRNDILESHDVSIATLDSEFDQKVSDKVSPADAKIEEDKLIGIYEHSLPISASCRQVCSIASELMKHLHGLELYTGARLVGESVSLYMKERAVKYDRRAASKKRMEEWQKKVENSPFIFEPYDEANNDDENSDDEASPFLSDDDGLDQDESSDLVESLRRGAMPPELRVLFGLALISEGGRNFVAAKCIEAIDDLEQESSVWLTEGASETERDGNSHWLIFRRAMTEPLGRTAAYAFLADVLRKTQKEREWAAHFSSWFRRHIDTLKAVGLMDELMRLRDDISPFVNMRKNQLLKIILASSSFDVDIAETPTILSPVDRKLIVTGANERIEVAMSAIKSLSDVLHLLWKVESDGSLPSICIEVVKVCNRCIRWFSKDAIVNLSYSHLNKILKYSRTVVSHFCGKEIPGLKGGEDSESLASLEWGEFPVETSWHSTDFRALSLRVYNLTVACNVSLFSGWEAEEFTLRLLRRRHGNKHFGVHLRDRRLTGYLSAELEEEISLQWTTLSALLPSFPEVKFSERLASIKNSDWYMQEVEDRKKRVDEAIARYAEEDGVSLCLSHSALCLHLATSESDPKVCNRLLQICFSILLPISQFCVDDTLWDSDIGEAASTLSGFDEWRLMTGVGPDSVIGALDIGKPRRRRKSEIAIEKKVQEWIKGTDKPTLHSFVTLPTSEMRNMWKAETSSNALDKNKETQEVDDEKTQEVDNKETQEVDNNKETQEKEKASECMNKVHTATTQLRACYTEMATEKASLQLSLALLDLALQPACFDPFACLQQAVMFASQASKAGNSDMAFRSSIPELKECTPVQALNILGRADCLHSVYFPNEAAYLCSYVAHVCRLHRDREEPDFDWNAKWKTVAIYAYNTSVMIRTAVSTVLDKNMQKSFLSMWERDVVEELERGRSDGWSWKRSLYNSNSALTPLENDFEDFDADVEEEEEVDVDAGSADDESDDVEAEEDEEEEDEEEEDEDIIDDAGGDELPALYEPQGDYTVPPLFLSDYVPFPTGAAPGTINGQDSDQDSMKDIEMVSV